MIVELGLKALHEPGVIQGRRQLRKHGAAWIMGGVEGGIQPEEAGNLWYFLILKQDGEASGWTGVSGFPERGFDPHLSPPSLCGEYS